MPRGSTSNPIKPLGPLATAITSFFSQPRANIRGVDVQSWPSPLQPVKPIGPPGAKPLGFNYDFGQNLTYTPRANEFYSAEKLRSLALYPLARACISNVKDIICQLPLNIRLKRMPGESGKNYARRKPDPGIVRAISDALEFPNPSQTRQEFLRRLLDDMLVIDGASVLFLRNRKGVIQEMRSIDGATITTYIDDQGYTPTDGNPAYAQVWYGLPRIDLTTDQLLYAPRNIVPRNSTTSYLYGMSPTEEAAPEIEIGASRLQFVLNYYTAGSVPDGIQVVPSDVNPDKIKETQDAIDSTLAGQLAKRRGLRLIQGFSDEGKDQFIFPKSEALSDAFDELHIRKIFFHYGTSPQRLMKMMNRASAESNQDSAEKEGTEPWIDWTETSIYNRIIYYYLGRTEKKFQDYEASFEQNADTDAVKQAAIDKSDVGGAIRTINEARDDRGFPPRTEPEADMLGIVTPTGFIPLDAQQQADRASLIQDATMPDPEPDEPPKGGKKPPAKPGDKKPKPKKSALAGSKKNSIRIDPHHGTPAFHQAVHRIGGALGKVFRRQKDRAIDETKRLLKARVFKATEDDAGDIADQIAAAVEAEWESIPAEVRPALEEAMKSGISNGIIQLELNDNALISAVNNIAADFAAARAAELVGMKYDAEGALVDNPAAEWAISDTTRDKIRSIVTDAFQGESRISDIADEIQQALIDDEAGIFTETRAQMIANTEVARAQAEGNFDVWKRSGLVQKLTWTVSADEPCDECADNEDVEVEFGKPFPSGDLYPPVHPNCRCVVFASQVATDDEE
jgi:phage portal protein BeeE